MDTITNEKGLSLIEMVVVTAIITSFSVFIVGLMSVTRDAVAIQNIGTPVRTEAKQTMDNIGKELREADLSRSITISNNGSNVNSQIQFFKPKEIGASGPTSYRCVIIYMDGTQIRKIQSDDINNCTEADPPIIGRNVDSIRFSHPNGSDTISATVNVTEASQETAATLVSTLTSQFKIRNGN